MRLGEGEDFTIVTERKCTDILCCLIFILFWIGMLIVGIVAFARGEPDRLHNGYDFTGEVCGFGANSEKSNVYYPYPYDDEGGSEPDLSWAACVTDCPQQTSVTPERPIPNLCARRFVVNDTVHGSPGVEIVCGGMDDGSTDLLQFTLLNRVNDYKEYCMERMPICSPCGTSVCCDGDNQIGSATEAVDKTRYPVKNLWGIEVGHKFGYCFVPYPSAAAFAGRCMPWVDESIIDPADLVKAYNYSGNNNASDVTAGALQSGLTALAKALSGPQETFNYLVDEVNTNKWIIAAGAGIALLLALLYTTLLRFAALPLSMVVLISLWVLLAGSTAILCVKAGVIAPDQIPIDGSDISLPGGTTWGPAETNQEMMMAACVIVGLVFLVYTVLLFFLIPRVVLAVKVIGIATECLTTCPSFLIFPVFQWFATVLLFLWWVFVMIYLAGVGEWSDETRTYDWDDTTRRAMIFHFFGLLWGRAFILAVGNLVIAGATAEWFLTDDKRALHMPLISGARRTFRFHLGTAAGGSFIIAVVQFIRWVFRYYMYQLKKMNPDNKLVKLLSCLGECCLACLERFLNFINKNAYIQCSIKATSFCPSAKNAVMLLIRNCLRIGTLTILANTFILVGKYLIAVGTAFLCALVIAGGDLGNITDAPIFSVTLICLLAFCIASAFMDVWEMVIDTIFQCYCMDLEYGTNKSGGKIRQVVDENPPKENDLKAVGSAM